MSKEDWSFCLQVLSSTYVSSQKERSKCLVTSSEHSKYRCVSGLEYVGNSSCWPGFLYCHPPQLSRTNIVSRTDQTFDFCTKSEESIVKCPKIPDIWKLGTLLREVKLSLSLLGIWFLVLRSIFPPLLVNNPIKNGGSTFAEPIFLWNQDINWKAELRSQD